MIKKTLAWLIITLSVVGLFVYVYAMTGFKGVFIGIGTIIFAFTLTWAICEVEKDIK